MDDERDQRPAPDATGRSGGDTAVDETTGLAGRGTGETAGYVGGRAEGVPGSAGARQMQQDDASRDDEPDANLAQADH
jgi:hypothetical protein